MEEQVLIDEVRSGFGNFVSGQNTSDGIATLWVDAEQVEGILKYLKHEIAHPFSMLYDLFVIDERMKGAAKHERSKDFTVVYHLLSIERNKDLRIKVAAGDVKSVTSVTGIWKNADWYEREAFDMFGIEFEGHPDLRRLLMPEWWQGHPLRKEHPARATETGIFSLPDEKQRKEEEILRYKPQAKELRELTEESESAEYLYLNIGPHHPGTHGVFRIILQLDGEEIVSAVPDIGFHHRAAEKMAERQTWHTYLPYTDRVEYLGGSVNNMAYVLAAEKLAGIEVPARAQVIRIMMCELFRIASHLVWLGTFAQDIGQLSPVFYMFTDREKIFEIISAVTGGRMHPGWFRIGGIAQDLPDGWEEIVQDFVNYFPVRLKLYNDLVMKNPVIRARTVGIGCYTIGEAIEWGVTGPGLRACGLDWDFRKKRPYSGYENFEFEVPTAENGDSYDRGAVRMEEMRQSLRIITQCLKNMPAGPYKAGHHLAAVPPVKERTMKDIETLITHFLSVSWGPVFPEGEASSAIEATKGINGYYLVSDGGVSAYRCRIRTPSFPHLQMLPYISKGYTVSDLIAILGSIDFVMSDVDR